MATVKSFENLVCWQKARELARFIYDITKYRNFEMDRGLVDQIRRAAVSVMSNVAEGFDRGTKMELINYFFIAKGSAGEVRSQLYIALDAGYIDMAKLRYGLSLTDHCSRLIQSFIVKVKSGATKGMQYKAVEKEDSYLKWFRENYPEDFKKYYNPETKQMEFWRRSK